MNGWRRELLACGEDTTWFRGENGQLKTASMTVVKSPVKGHDKNNPIRYWEVLK